MRVVHLSRGWHSVCGLSHRDKPNARFVDHIRDVTCGACQRGIRSQRRIALRRLRGWGEDVATLYKARVYLVGSTLTSGKPRDTDVRAVLPDDAFAERWMPVDAWREQGQTGEWDDRRHTWARECAEVAAHGRRQTLYEIDFQAIPVSVHVAYEGAVPMLIAEPQEVPR